MELANDIAFNQIVSTAWTLRIATRGPGDRLNLTPLWFYWAGGRFYAFTRGQKLANLRRDPNCTVTIDAGERYPELHGAMVHATAKILGNAEASARTIISTRSCGTAWEPSMRLVLGPVRVPETRALRSATGAGS